MNKTDFKYPRDSYVDLAREFYAGIDGAGAATPAQETSGPNWWCHTQTSRGDILEKAGWVLMHIVDGKIYNSPGRIKQFETLTYPRNPRVPGLVFLANLNETEAGGQSVVMYTDLVFQTGEPHAGAIERFVAAIQPVYTRHGLDFSARYKGEPGRIMAGLSAECGVMDFLPADTAGPVLDDLLPATFDAYRDILDLTGDSTASEADYAATLSHRARLVEWLTLEDIGIRFARESGMPLEPIEAYGYPPVVRY